MSWAIERFRERRYSRSARYETWVQYASRRPPVRVDLAQLAAALDPKESNGRWKFDGVQVITPRLRMEGSPSSSAGDGESSIAPETFRAKLEAFLCEAEPAWDPYGRP